MSEYANTLASLRKARTARDEASTALYAVQLKKLWLERKQRKAEAGEVEEDAALQKSIDALRNNLQQAEKELAETDAQIKRLQATLENCNRNAQLIKELLAEQSALKKRLEEINHTLENGQNSPGLRKKLEEAKRTIEAQLAAIPERLPALEAVANNCRHEQQSVQQQLDALNAQLGNRQENVNHIRQQLEQETARITRKPDQQHEVEAAKHELKEAVSRLRVNESRVNDLLNTLFLGKTPMQLIEEWDDSLPVLLLPLRVEIRFRSRELWVRVFPDEIAVNTHEKNLTDTESEHGRAYWKALFEATTETARKEAWRIMADRFGTNRSAWVAQQTKPQNWNSQPAPASSNELIFAEQKLIKPDSWTQAPHTRVMPDRLVLMVFRNGVQVHSKTGNQISDHVVLGPAPLSTNENPAVTRDAENRLDFGNDLKWLHDFDTAVQQGLGFKLPISDEDAERGFDQLLVLGVKHSMDENDTPGLIEELLHNHHYSRKGLSLVPQGAATNNTDGDDSGFDSNDFLFEKGYFNETGQPNFTPETDVLKMSDGQRLCDYLGLPYSTLQYVSGSGNTDTAEALTMNRALYAGTIGYYLNSMLNEVMSDAQEAKVREMFCNHVTGRGPMPALRVGKQPYGILLTSDFDNWTWPHTRKSNPHDLFAVQVYELLKKFSAFWKLLRPQLAHISKAGNPGENLMSVLGLHPSSVQFHQRVGYSFDYLKNLDDFSFGGEYMLDVIMMAFEQSNARNFLRNLGYDDTRPNGTLKPVPHLLQLIFRHYHTRLDPKQLIDSNPFSETELIAPYDRARDVNYIDWLVENAGDTDKLESRNFGTRQKAPDTLLFMLLHHALLHEAKYSIRRLLMRNNISADELIRSRTFLNMSASPDLSPWEVFRAPAATVIQGELSSKPLLEFIQEPQFTSGINWEVARSFTETVDAMRILRNLPTARLERALTEHIDLLTYRIDAWQTGLFDMRLQKQRSEKGKSGIYAGAYGYLENVKPDSVSRVKIPESVLPEALRENKNNLYQVPEGGGYAHTPSLNHAAAAALLRNGYLTHASAAEREKLSINLSSERVRRALVLLEGIRNGQTLEALLGYQFERGMHDWTTRSNNPVFLNQLKPYFRKAFPIKRTKVPRRGIVEPEEVINDFSVVNGISIINAPDSFPAGVPDLPPLDAAQTAALKAEKNNIENSLDALHDLLLSESAYQLALGNFDRAAAVMQAVSGAQMPPEIDVIRSTHGSDLSFTQRVVLHTDTLPGSNPWPAINYTLRAATEPGINRWIASLLGNPDTISCMVRAVNDKGETLLDETAAPVEGAVSLADLNIQATDFVHIIRSRAESAAFSELESRIRFAFARRKNLDENIVTEITFTKSGSSNSSVRSFAEIMPLADYIRQLISKARPATARDYITASKKVTDAPANPGMIDVDELRTRVQALLPFFDSLATSLDTALTNASLLKNETALNALRDALVTIADAGLVHAWPASSNGYSDALLEELVAQTESVQTRIAALKTEFETKALSAAEPGKSIQAQAAIYTEMAQLFLGGEYRILTRFTLLNFEEAVKADSSRTQLLAYSTGTKQIPFPAEEWLHGLAQVRPALHTLQLIYTLHENLLGGAINLSPVQLPWRDNDSWLGCEFPPGTAIVHDTLSVMQIEPGHFNPAGILCGLVIDEWTESMPRREETTGIAFHFNQPDSAPPQALLYTLSPQLTGQWKWNGLVSSVLDTMERAKLRAIEPDQLETRAGLSTLLPAVLSEFSTGKSTISLDLALILPEIQQFYANTALINFTQPGN
ncbi:MAG: hypothetical protein MUC87_09060 [Bacteroidia bacterium]|jgi:hypothetical protein|nr:hypothetical protein [Bacteroidia bacterium]